MKVFFTMFMTTSLTYAACPNLAGTWVCVQEDESSEMTITQKVEDGITIYKWQEEGQEDSTLYADGRAVAIDEDGVKGSYNAHCSDDDKLMITGEFNSSANEIDFNIKLNGFYQIKDDDNLVSEFTNTVTYLGQENVEKEMNECTRK